MKATAMIFQVFRRQYHRPVHNDITSVLLYYWSDRWLQRRRQGRCEQSRIIKVAYSLSVLEIQQRTNNADKWELFEEFLVF